jgi:NAD(P)-dependent dehydrogenase (short-subunit alcohol dehydrogenase family)
MRGKVCLVTGATQGVGRQVAEGLARLDAKVLVHGRDATKVARTVAELRSASGNPDVHGITADFAVQDEVRRMVAEVEALTDRLHVLVSNAGTFAMQRVETVDGHELTFAVNHLAPFILVNGLVDRLKAGAPSRVVIVASEAHQRVRDVEDWESRKSYGSVTAYSRSKLANVLFAYDLAHRLEGTGVTVNACHPGLVNTALLQSGFDRWYARWLWPIVQKSTITPEEGAETPLYLATSPEVEGVTGKYYKRQRPATSSLISHDATIGARLWNISLRYTGQLSELEITGEHIAG